MNNNTFFHEKCGLDVLCFGAHPDDSELCGGGTLAALTNQGKKAGVIDLTRGEKGSRGTPESRKQEAAKAAEIIGLEVRTNLDLPDTQLENTPSARAKIISQVRKHRPHICLVGAPSDRHPDHGNATDLVLDALFYSGLIKIETTDADGNKQEPWRPSHILHYMQDRPFKPDVIVDISETFDVKQKAVRAFNTQFDVDDPGDEPETYISGKRFFQQIEARARYFGHLIGATYGEPFQYYNGPIPLQSFDVFFETKPRR
jgi:bacillithiol biosynthesis deacetylase BshB1